MVSFDPELCRELVRRALAEDVGTGDVTTAAIVGPQDEARAMFVAKADCILAGIEVAIEVFRQLGPATVFGPSIADGARCRAGEVFATLEGKARDLLIGERTALNFLQRLSGIATRTRAFVDAAGGRIIILDTRKTTPTLRALEKYAVRVGGGSNHRAGLYDAMLIKDNHIRIAGSIARAVSRARAYRPGMAIEVEAERLDQVDEAVSAGAEVILLDNMSTRDIREAVGRVGGRAKIEISGGVTLERIPELAATGADFVSVGALTHSAPAIDISLEIEPVPAGRAVTAAKHVD